MIPPNSTSRRKRFKRAETISVIAVVVTILSNVTTILISNQQVKLAKDNYSYTKDLTQKQLRAYLEITNILLKLDETSGRPTYTLDIKNTGSTPAKDIITWGRFQLSTSTAKDNPVTILERLFRKSLPSGGVSTSELTVNYDLSEFGKAAKDRGDIVYTLELQISYLDVFGTKQLDKFCLANRPGPMTNPAKIQFCDQ